MPARAKADEKPITKADIITDGAPKSLADAMRHNRAVQAVNAVNAAEAIKSGKGKPHA